MLLRGKVRDAPEPTGSGANWETHGWTAESVRGYDWRKVGESHPQQHIGAHYRGVWNENCLECERLREDC